MFRFFINNPIFSSVIAIIIVLCGLVSMAILPLEEYPNITPPTITISAHYPGANAKVLERTVASPIEDQINGASGMIYMNSTMSSNGDYNLIVTFATGTDLNNIIGDVLNRLNSALPVLPNIVQRLGVTMRKSSQNLLMSIAMQSNSNYDNLYLSNYVYRSIYTELSRIKGVGEIDLPGARTYSMRLWLALDKMAKLGVSIAEVTAAIQEQNIQVAVGKTGVPPTAGQAALTFNLNGQGYYTNPKQFAKIVIRQESGNYIRVKDIARVELGALSYDTINQLNLIDSVGLQLYLAPGANQLTTHAKVIETMEKLAQQFPPGITYKVAFDNTKFIEKSLANVLATLRDACILVVLVVFLFLQKGKATLIPILTIPVSIIGTFAGMYLAGFSINNLTLFGLILSIGIVVDDSIVVIENVERIMRDYKLNAKQASIQTMQEVAGALIAIVLVLCCAFVPSAFLTGLTGILYRQFALTISIAVIISGVTALTLTPALCAILLKNSVDFQVTNRFFLRFNQWLNHLTDNYITLLRHMIQHKLLYMLVFSLILISSGIIYSIVPIGFIPNEDKGFFTTQITLPNNASLARTTAVTQSYVKNLLQDKTIANNIAMIGIDQLNSNGEKTNAATVISTLVDWDLRDTGVEQLINAANTYGGKQKAANFVAYNQPAIDGLSSTNGVEFYVEDKVAGDYAKLQYYLTQIIGQLKHNQAIKDAYFNFNAEGTEVAILADVDRAKMYQVNIADIYNVLATNFGPNLVNYFYKMGDLYWVTLQGDTQFRRTPFQLSSLYVKNAIGQMVPISSVTNTTFATAPDTIERFNDYLAAKVVVIPNPNYTIQNVMTVIKQVTQQVLPHSYAASWYGVSFQQQASSFSSLLAFTFGILMIFLVLAGQFEMWRLPLVVIMGVPFALFGAGLMLLSRGLSNDLYFQISLITLLGLSAKNSILITEFAIEHCRKHKLNAIDAVILAAKQRFRPIIMTSLAFILGALPLAFARGANSNAEHSVGSGIIGGMLGSTFIATIFVPMFFVIIMGKKEFTQKAGLE